MTISLSTPVLLAAALLTIGCNKRSSDEQEKSSAASEAKDVASAPAAAKLLPIDDMKMPQLPAMPGPEADPLTEAKVALGHQLFFDKRLSVDGSVSCYSCHQNEHGNGGETKTAVGAKGKKLTRHSPIIWNVGYLPLFYWDGRAPSLEAQALGAWAGGNMGVGKPGLAAKANEIAAIEGYASQFEQAFPDKPVTPELVAEAIASYERTLICNDTAYDRYAAGNKKAMTPEQKAGLDLFMGKAMCTACHAPPHFSTAYLGEGVFYNTGIGTRDIDKEAVDKGRMAVTQKAEDWAAFKPPTLRNVTNSAPYFHDGHIADLRRAVEVMASGGYENDGRSPLLSDKKLSDAELDSLVSFLGALSCDGKLEEPKLPE